MLSDNSIPKDWRHSFSKATTLSEVADLFNEAEQYSDFDCCAELEVWCKDHPAKMAGLQGFREKMVLNVQIDC